jgi:hypothetical protein
LQQERKQLECTARAARRERQQAIVPARLTSLDWAHTLSMENALSWVCPLLHVVVTLFLSSFR